MSSTFQMLWCILAAMFVLQVAAVKPPPVPMCSVTGCEACKICDVNTGECIFDKAGSCGIVPTDKCRNVDCAKCTECNPSNGQCEEKKCGVCESCNDNGVCEKTLSTQCGIDKRTSPIELCPENKCTDKCSPCNPVNGLCEPIVCAQGLNCKDDTGNCQPGNIVSKCKPECGLCEYCAWVPTKECTPRKCGTNQVCENPSGRCVPKSIAD